MTGKKKRLCNLNPEKNWGGRRENGGFQPKWRHSPTKLVRIPQALEEPVIAYAHGLDNKLAGDAPVVTAASICQRIPEPLYGDKGLIQPSEQSDIEDTRQKALTLEAITNTVARWKTEASRHKTKTQQWAKIHEFLKELESDLHNPWL